VAGGGVCGVGQSRVCHARVAHSLTHTLHVKGTRTPSVMWYGVIWRGAMWCPVMCVNEQRNN